MWASRLRMPAQVLHPRPRRAVSGAAAAAMPASRSPPRTPPGSVSTISTRSSSVGGDQHASAEGASPGGTRRGRARALPEQVAAVASPRQPLTAEQRGRLALLRSPGGRGVADARVGSQVVSPDIAGARPLLRTLRRALADVLPPELAFLSAAAQQQSAGATTVAAPVLALRNGAELVDPSGEGDAPVGGGALFDASMVGELDGSASQRSGAGRGGDAEDADVTSDMVEAQLAAIAALYVDPGETAPPMDGRAAAPAPAALAAREDVRRLRDAVRQWRAFVWRVRVKRDKFVTAVAHDTRRCLRCNLHAWRRTAMASNFFRRWIRRRCARLHLCALRTLCRAVACGRQQAPRCAFRALRAAVSVQSSRRRNAVAGVTLRLVTLRIVAIGFRSWRVASAVGAIRRARERRIGVVVSRVRAAMALFRFVERCRAGHPCCCPARVSGNVARAHADGCRPCAALGRAQLLQLFSHASFSSVACLFRGTGQLCVSG